MLKYIDEQQVHMRDLLNNSFLAITQYNTQYNV